MKISKIHFIDYKIFKNHQVIFTDDYTSKISYLVGNNGSGKTIVLEAIYSLLTNTFNLQDDFEIEYAIQLADAEKNEFSISDNKIIAHIVCKRGGIVRTFKDTSDRTLSIDFYNQVKVVYSTIEVVFNEQNFPSVTAKNIDDIPYPKEKSINLSNEIPQLMIDIEAIDNAEISKWVYENGNTEMKCSEKPRTIGTRLERFTNAFNEMYDGSKKFKEIRNNNNAKQIVFVDSVGNEILLSQLSTGEKQIIYRLGYLLKNLNNLNGGVVLIDEPEISMHPIWQIRLKDLIKKIFDELDVHIILATHSPYIFQALNNQDEEVIKLDRTKEFSKKIQYVFYNPKILPSVSLISYLAYGIPTDSLHNELYTELQIKEGINDITKMDNWFKDSLKGNVKKLKEFERTVEFKNKKIGDNVIEALPTYIRNAIHHGDETARQYKKADLQESIKILLKLLKKK